MTRVANTHNATKWTNGARNQRIRRPQVDCPEAGCPIIRRPQADSLGAEQGWSRRPWADGTVAEEEDN